MGKRFQISQEKKLSFIGPMTGGSGVYPRECDRSIGDRLGTMVPGGLLFLIRKLPGETLKFRGLSYILSQGYGDIYNC
ncbi:hypothetical protein [Thermotalea metallivorans]|uniref:hypothetical protein n=1 Tax=Thermotalea metallivorans TaxID=520762 RepID=UPI0008396AE9|nr:hypothetical protein [Thermotalea metallivorans]